MSSNNNNNTTSAADASLGNIARGEPGKTSGQYHSMKGTVIEGIGNLTGATSWTQAGKDEHSAGETEYNAAQAKAQAEGALDRIAGKKDSVLGAVTGDKQQQAMGNLRSEQGQTKQQMN